MFVRFIRKDDAGSVGLAEVTAGFEQALRHFVDSQLPLDQDCNGDLTLAEQAASIPVEDGDQTDAEGFTNFQR